MTWLQQYQTLVAGLVGFTGVVITLFVNAWLSRRQEARALELPAAILRRSLRSELASISEIYEHRVSDLRAKAPGSHVSLPIDTSIRVYPKLLHDIGLLNPNTMYLVIRAYALAEELPVRLRFLRGPEVWRSGRQHFD